jgi:hypothetical protein
MSKKAAYRGKLSTLNNWFLLLEESGLPGLTGNSDRAKDLPVKGQVPS